MVLQKTKSDVREGRPKPQMKEHLMRKSIVTVLAAAAFAGGFATPALADEPVTETVSVVVSYGDLDVADPADANALTQRIDVAVEKVCHRPDIRDLKGNVAYEECKAAALAGAMEQLSLTQPYAEIEFASRF
jgi:UrcA family protein